MIDLQLNLAGGYSDSDVYVENGDFAIRDGKFSLVPEDEAGMQLAQRLHVRLLLRRGECFFNTAAGFPYTELSKFKRSSGVFDTYMKSYIMGTDGVRQLQRYTSELDASNRLDTVKFDVVTQDDQTVNIVQELDV